MQQRWALVCAALAVFFAMPAAAQSLDRLEGKNVSIAQTTYKGRSAIQVVALVNDLKLEPRGGGVALWVGPGTEGYFANLKITSR